MKHAFLAPLVLALPLAVLSPLPAPQFPLPIASCPNPLPRELLVSYDVTGGTLSGPIDFHLDVYSDGGARLSSAYGDGAGVSHLAYVAEADARELQRELIAAGALRQCDVDLLVSDTPLSTLTVLRGPSRQIANSFSWYAFDEQVAEMVAVLDAFIAAHFPLLPGHGTKF